MTNPKPVSIKPAGLGNPKGFPVNPTPETLYFFYYNRETRRKHTKDQKGQLMLKCWQDYNKHLDEYTEKLKEYQKEVENGSKDTEPGGKVCYDVVRENQESKQS